jgi:hypothetical protein
MKTVRAVWKPVVGVLVLAAVGLAAHGCKPPDPPILGPAPDADNDGVVDANDNCPSLPGELRYSGCPWYRVDVCSGNKPYSLGAKWVTATPTFYYASSLPSTWRDVVDYAASTWNQVGAKVTIKKYTTIVSLPAQKDGKSVIAYGPLPDGIGGETRRWALYGIVIEADIVLNSRAALSIGGSATTADVQAIMTHEFGHFLGLQHVDDRTHTMHRTIPMNSTIHRTLCAGDVDGLKKLYP